MHAKGAHAGLARTRGLCLVEASCLLVTDLLVQARELGLVIPLVGLVIDADLLLEIKAVQEGQYLVTFAGELPFKFAAQPFAHRLAAGLGLGELHHHRRQGALLIGPLVFIHTYRDRRGPAFDRHQPRKVRPTGLLRELEAKSFNVLVVLAGDELRPARAGKLLADELR